MATRTEATPGPWLGRGLLLAAIAVLLVQAWPERARPLYFFDSQSYVRWPHTVVVEGETLPRSRPPTYPLALKVLGRGPALVHAQTWLSLLAFCALGWAAARGPGLVVGGLFALGSAVRMWNLALLTEAFTLALLALLLALSLRMLAGGRSPWLLAGWGATVLAFAGIRDGNLVWLPFLALLFLPRRDVPGTSWSRFAIAAAALVALMLVGLAAAERNQRWKAPTYTAIVTRIAADPETHRAFVEQGMPRGIPFQIAPEMERWLAEGGRRLYLRWALGRPESYAAAAAELTRRDAADVFREEYFEKVPGLPAALLTGLADALQRALSPPLWLWLPFVLLPAALSRWRLGHFTSLSLVPPVLAVAAYGGAFASYWGAGTEETRHVLAAATLYRISFALCVPAIAGVFSELEAAPS